jgi:hypothetical protein
MEAAMVDAEWTYAIFRRSISPCTKHWIDPATQLPLLLTPADQIVGAHIALTNFRKAYSQDYGRIIGRSGTTARGAWESHHIVEGQDLDVLRSLGLPIPKYEVCPAVLLPPEAHRSRVNRVLPRGVNRLLADLESYDDAYGIVGNYTGAGEQAIKRELMAVCRAIIIL